MKYLTKALLLLMFVFTLSNCTKGKKEVDSGQEETTDVTSEVAPATFSQKVVLEEFTGEWCGYCPYGAQIMQDIVTAHPNDVVAVALHSGDPFALSYESILGNKLGVPGYPSAGINRLDWNGTRAPYRNEWSSDVNAALQMTPVGGVKIETQLNSGKINIDVYAAVNENTDSGTVSVYLVEDDIPESSPGAQTNGGGSYVHHHVLRKVVANASIDLKNGFVSKKSFNDIDVSNYVLANLKVVCVLSHKAPNYDVYNVQDVEAGQNSNWN